jgi:hypothetical protein
LLTIFDHPTLAEMSDEIEKLILAKLDLAKIEPTSDAPAVSQPAGEYR